VTLWKHKHLNKQHILTNSWAELQPIHFSFTNYPLNNKIYYTHLMTSSNAWPSDTGFPLAILKSIWCDMYDVASRRRLNSRSTISSLSFGTYVTRAAKLTISKSRTAWITFDQFKLVLNNWCLLCLLNRSNTLKETEWINKWLVNLRKTVSKL